jgi:polar amino acid transport system substrate-binding protein
MWGPVAGYENKKTWSSRWRVTPVAGHDLNGAVAVAVRRGKDALAADIDRALSELKPQIAALAEKYGFPLETPVNLAVASVAPDSALRVPAAWVQVVNDLASPKPVKAAKPRDKATTAAAKAAAPAAVTAVVAAPAAALSESAGAGRVMFNDKCSHCHGTDGFSPVRERDVRYLKTRYNDKWVDAATLTIKNGRPDAGMPVWKEILKEPEVQQILSFLTSIQK